MHLRAEKGLKGGAEKDSRDGVGQTVFTENYEGGSQYGVTTVGERQFRKTLSTLRFIPSTAEFTPNHDKPRKIS